MKAGHSDLIGPSRTVSPRPINLGRHRGDPDRSDDRSEPRVDTTVVPPRFGSVATPAHHSKSCRCSRLAFVKYSEGASKHIWNLVEGDVLGIAGLVIGILGWAGDGYTWIVIALSSAVVVGAVTLFYFQNLRERSSDTAE